MSTESELNVDEKKEADAEDPPPAKKVKPNEAEEDSGANKASDNASVCALKTVEAIDPEHVSIEAGSEEIKITATSSKVHAVVLGKDVLADGSNWKVSVDTIGDLDWILAGIISNQNPGGKSYQDPTSFGWAGSFEVYSEGINMSMKAAHRGGWIKWQEGDEAIFRLTSDAIKMYNSRLKKTFAIPIPEKLSKHDWRLHLSFFSPRDCVRISVPTPEELGRLDG